MGVFQRDQGRLREVGVGRGGEFVFEFGEIHRTGFEVGDRDHRDTAQDRTSAGFIYIAVRHRPYDHIAAARTMDDQRYQIRHRTAGHQQRGLLAGQIGGHLLEPVDGRILTVDVVAKIGARNRLAHLRGR